MATQLSSANLTLLDGLVHWHQLQCMSWCSGGTALMRARHLDLRSLLITSLVLLTRRVPSRAGRPGLQTLQ